MFRSSVAVAALAAGACTITLPASASPLCDPSYFQVEPDYRYAEEDFSVEAVKQSLDALRGPIPEWVDRAGENGWDISLTSGELGMAYQNNLNHLEGYILHQLALAERVSGEDGKQVQDFCKFLASTSIID